uniref:Uncharacterized protein n=1 Tax=Myotis myotis TaxID=51298 RepID=A0A7J7ZXI4_MYOMY|nr:hypothetical protein mMyoMyo1_009773 [Myotis myotis]
MRKIWLVPLENAEFHTDLAELHISSWCCHTCSQQMPCHHHGRSGGLPEVLPRAGILFPPRLLGTLLESLRSSGKVFAFSTQCFSFGLLCLFPSGGAEARADDVPGGHGNLAYIKEVKAQVLELPYMGKELSMLILLPKHKWTSASEAEEHSVQYAGFGLYLLLKTHLLQYDLSQ